MSTGVFLLLFVAGAAAVGIWAYVRWPRLGPSSLRGAGAHVLASLALCTVLVPVAGDLLMTFGRLGRLGLVMGVAFPALAYGCLATIWLLRLAVDALGRLR